MSGTLLKMLAIPRKMSCTMQNVGHNTLNVCQVTKGRLEIPTRAPRGPPTPIFEKERKTERKYQLTNRQSLTDLLKKSD